MVFTSHLFVFYFLPLVLVGYYLLPATSRWRNPWLLLTSYVFYGWWNPWFVLLMVFVTTLNYGCGLAMAADGASGRRRKVALLTAVVGSLGTLVFFKYAVFAQQNLSLLLQVFGAEALTIWQVILPIGISFYVFHALSYAIDVYRGTAAPTRSFLDFATYIALFPQSVAGPIIRYNTVADHLHTRTHSLSQFSSGVALFILGFAKKVLIANPIGIAADAAFNAQHLDAGAAWFGLVAYAFQLYFDFCGYSDMAVGLGRMFGFEFMKNFDAPYHADSITDFWRRWHLSLSSFLRDYLYIPLGGNRRGETRTYLNLAVVMLLGGLWHGANWTFIIWGAWHGLLLIAERWAGRQPSYQRFPRPLRIAATFLLILGSWVWFRAESATHALTYFAALAGQGTPDASTALLSARLYTPMTVLVLVVAAVLVLGRTQAHSWSQNITWPKTLVLILLFLLALAALSTQDFNPFLYFQF